MVLQRNKKGNKQKIMGSKVVLRIAFSYRKPIENNNNNPNILDQNFISYVKLTKLFFTISLLANFDQIKTRATFKAFSLLKLKPNFGEFSFFSIYWKSEINEQKTFVLARKFIQNQKTVTI